MQKTDCKKCPLHLSRRNIVYGRGEVPADILFIGEAPGVNEDALGKPFIGRSGKLLDLLIKKSGLELFSYYMTNCIGCRPPENRTPKREEILACKENVLRTYDKINPTIIVLIGDIAKKYYEKQFPLYYHIYHPAYLLRTGGESSPYFLSNLNQLKNIKIFLEKENFYGTKNQYN
jgi:uracil-DNA glycosylase